MVIYRLVSKVTAEKLSVSFMIWFLLTVSLLQITVSYSDDTVTLNSIEKVFQDGLFTLKLNFNRPPTYSAYWVNDNQYLFFDLIGSNILCINRLKIDIDLPGVEYAEVEFYPGYEPTADKPGKVDGIRLAISKASKYDVSLSRKSIDIKFPFIKEASVGKGREAFVDKDVDKEVDIPKIFSFMPNKRIGPKNEREWQEAIWGWRPWLEIGVENYRELKVAQSQYELAQLKLSEAKRQLFPNAIIRVTDTSGATVGDVDIFSKSYELELEQPISYGGELRYKIEQAEINRELSLYEHKRLYSDYSLELKRSYYSVVLNRMNWDTFNKLIKEANKIFALGEVLYQQQLITELEYGQLQSSYHQVKFFFISAQKELSLAELSFRQILNMPEDEEINFVNWLPFERVNVDMDKALEIAKIKRPELRIRQLVSHFNNLNEQIAKAKNRCRISLTSKVGQMAEGYESEDKVFRDSWYVGLKVTKPIGTSTLSSSVTKQSRPAGGFSLEETTESFTRSTELSLVDRLGSIADIKTAQTEHLKALNEELESEETIVAEVSKSYANYISSLFQIETSLRKLDFLNKRLKVTEGKMKIEEADITALMQSYLDYANEKVNYNRALIGYYMALSGLSKACGVESFLSLTTDRPVITAWEKFGEHPSANISYTPFLLPDFKKESREATLTGIEGRIIGVNNQHEMAILNIGNAKGLTPSSKVVVYRNGREYALLIPARIEGEMSACYLEKGIGDNFKGLRIGDNVEIMQ
ncbi:MAG: TolC family protein [Candidatus Kaelpia imicola]|nr:TolC family protein [Candidatus Kaelpia imicola]